jgi:hypothetical protein
MNRPQYPRAAAAAGGGQIAVLPEPHQVGALVSGVKGFVRRHPVVSASFVFGWVDLVLVGSGSALTVQQYSQYNQIMNTIDLCKPNTMPQVITLFLDKRIRPLKDGSGPVMGRVSDSKDIW